MENFVCILSKTKGHPGDHVKTVHEGILIICGLRSFGRTVKPAVWSASAASCGTCRAKREVRNVSPKERRPQMIRVPS